MIPIDPLSLLARPAAHNWRRRVSPTWRFINSFQSALERINEAFQETYGPQSQIEVVLDSTDELRSAQGASEDLLPWLLSIDCLCSEGELSVVFSSELVRAFAVEQTNTNEMITSFLYSVLQLFSKSHMSRQFPGTVLSVRRISRISSDSHPDCRELSFAIRRGGDSYCASLLISRSLLTHSTISARRMRGAPRGLRFEEIAFIDAKFQLGWGAYNLLDIRRLKKGQRFELRTASLGTLSCTALPYDRRIIFEGATDMHSQGRIRFSIHSIL